MCFFIPVSGALLTVAAQVKGRPLITLWWGDVALKEAVYDEVLGVNVRLHVSVKVESPRFFVSLWRAPARLTAVPHPGQSRAGGRRARPAFHAVHLRLSGPVSGTHPFYTCCAPHLTARRAQMNEQLDTNNLWFCPTCKDFR